MGLFNNKQPSKQTSSADDATDAAVAIFDQQYRDELRQLGRDHFKQLIDSSASDLKNDIDAAMKQVAIDLKDYMTRQLDVTISNVNTEITNQLNERISEFNRVTAEAQDLASQSLNRNAQAVQEKYQQLSATLQQTVASQEVQMITVFQDNKAKIVNTQAEQDKILDELTHTAEISRQKSEQLHQSMQQAIADQSDKLTQIYQANLSQIAEAKKSQDAALESLNSGSEALRQKHQQLSELLDKSVADQKAMLIETINGNMARIIEHYLIGALGEQSDLKSQLPSILERLEQNKQAMTEDMQL